MATAFRRWNARRRSPSMRALREAGPPIRWIVAAIPLALAAVIVLYVAGVENEAVLLAIPFVAFVLVGPHRPGWLADPDGDGRGGGSAARALAHGNAPDRSAERGCLADRASRCSTRGTRVRPRHRRDVVRRPSPCWTPPSARRRPRRVGIARLRLTLDPAVARGRGGTHGARRDSSVSRSSPPCRPRNGGTTDSRLRGRSRGCGSSGDRHGEARLPPRSGTSGPSTSRFDTACSTRSSSSRCRSRTSLALLIVWALGLGDALLRD